MKTFISFNLNTDVLGVFLAHCSHIGQVENFKEPDAFFQGLLNKEYNCQLFSIDDQAGFLVANRMIQDEKYHHIPKIAISTTVPSLFNPLIYQIGIDDLLEKPQDGLVLQARIKGKVKRFQKISESKKQISNDYIQLDLSRLFCQVKKDESWASVDLTPNEFKVLWLFASAPEQIFTRDQIIDRVWGVGIAINDRVIDTHVSSLRKKLENTGVGISTIYGLGYRLSFTKENS